MIVIPILEGLIMNLSKAGLFALTVLTPLKAFGHEAPIRVVVIGDDSDRNAVSRSSEIYTRVVAELQQCLTSAPMGPNGGNC